MFQVTEQWYPEKACLHVCLDGVFCSSVNIPFKQVRSYVFVNDYQHPLGILLKP